MIRRSAALALIASFVTASWGACSSQESAPSPETGGADAGGSGAVGGVGAATGGTSPAGGKGGAGGSPVDGGEWGTPIWEPIPGTAVGCTFERMTNAASVRFLKWEPCSWTDGCEQAVFNPMLAGEMVNITPQTNVFDDGTTVRAGLNFYSLGQYVSAITDDTGMGLDAIRVTGGKPDCKIFGPSIWGKRFAIEVDSPDFKHFGGVIGDIGAMNTPPTPFTIPEPAPGGNPQKRVLGSARYLWWWTPVDRFSTVSSKDGSEFQIFAQVTYSSSVVSYRAPATTGPLFLAQEAQVMDGGQVQHKIAYSDGVSPMKPYLVPETPNDDYGEPAFANTHVGFLRGVNQKGVNVYDSVEIWASPYSTIPSELKPELVGTLPYPNMCYLVGGWGRLGTCAKLPPSETLRELGVAVWTVATKSVRNYPVPKDYFPSFFMGVTRSHLWVGAKADSGNHPYLMRFKVE